MKSFKFRSCRLWLAALVVILVCVAVPAPVQAGSGTVRFDNITVKDGLSQTTVWSVAQDHLGFMWIGTEDGLNKWDGYAFTIYKHDPENPLTIGHSTILEIYEDRAGTLWFGTIAGLDRFNREEGTFTHFVQEEGDDQSLSGQSVISIVEDHLGNLWVATSDGGLNLLNRETGTFRHYRHDPNDPASLADNNVTDLLEDRSGNLWVATVEGLDRLDRATGTFIHHQKDPSKPGSLNDNLVTALHEDREGFLWVGTYYNGLNRYDPATGGFRAYRSLEGNNLSLIHDQVRSILEDSSGQLWVGTRTGLDLFDREQGVFIHYRHDPNDPYSLSNDAVVTLYEDRSGAVWVGTYGGGVSRYSSAMDKFKLYQHRPFDPNSLSDNVVYSIMEDRSGVLWVGTMDSGLNRIDRQHNVVKVFRHNFADPDSLSINDVRVVYQDRQGAIWIGTYGGGLDRFEPGLQTFTHFRHDPKDPTTLGDDVVRAIYEDRRGNLWIGTRAGGLNLMNRKNGTFQQFVPDSNDSSSIGAYEIRALFEDSRGRLWVGTTNGVSVMDPVTRKFTHYANNPLDPTSLSSNMVVAIAEDSDGVMWFGTLLGGLNRLDASLGTFAHYTEKDGLPNNTIYGILTDDQGNLWLSTNMGLSRFDPRAGTFRNFDYRDGLQSNEFCAGAYYKSAKGEIFFGGVEGFNSFYPSRVKDNSLPPPVVVTAFKIFNQIERSEIAEETYLDLSYQDNYISFEFAALDFNTPEKNQYAYKLEGFDKDWIYSGNRRYASYTNLRGGSYTFRVKGANSDGVWNEDGVAIHIKVVPPIWANVWFPWAAGGFVLAVAFLGYRVRVKQIQTQNISLEKQVSDRTAEIERRRQVAEGLREIIALLNTNRPLRESLDAIIEQAVRLMGAREALIFQCDQGRCASILAASGQEAKPCLAALPAWVSQATAGGEPLVLPDVDRYLASLPSSERVPISGPCVPPVKSLIAAPVPITDTWDGGMVLLFDHLRVFSEEDVKMSVTLAEHAALAMANARLRTQAEETAVSAERSRLARDLHDAVTQTLFATSLIADVLPRIWQRNPEEGLRRLAEVRDLTRGALAEMRTLLLELRPAALVDANLTDLLRQLGEAFQGRARIPVDLQADPSPDLPPDVKITLYRIAQEAMNNAAKHSGASRLSLQLAVFDGGVEMLIVDDGCGFEPERVGPDHLGLGIMAERAQAVGAVYNLCTAVGKGTQITVRWQDLDRFSA